MRVELWSYDEYGQGSIIKSGNDIDEMIAEGTRFLTNSNVNNALAASEKEKSWEAYMPVIVKRGKVTDEMLYAGNRKNGKHQVWVKGKKGEYSLGELPKDATVRFVLGEVDTGSGKLRKKETWFFADHKGNVVEKLEHPDLQAKTQVFLKILP